MIDLFGGIKIFANPWLPTTLRVQYKFPRSKKRRIRKKWAKRSKNYRDVDCRNDIHVIAGLGFVVHPDGYENLKKALGLVGVTPDE